MKNLTINELKSQNKNLRFYRNLLIIALLYMSIALYDTSKQSDYYKQLYNTIQETNNSIVETAKTTNEVYFHAGSIHMIYLLAHRFNKNTYDRCNDYKDFETFYSYMNNKKEK